MEIEPTTFIWLRAGTAAAHQSSYGFHTARRSSSVFFKNASCVSSAAYVLDAIWAVIPGEWIGLVKPTPSPTVIQPGPETT